VKKKLLSLVAIIALGSGFVGCGSSSDDSNGGGSSTKTGNIVDAPIKGLTYSTTSGLSGTTTEDGEFKYRSGDKITFKIGSLILGKITTAKSFITPYDLADNNDTALNIAYFLQNLDGNKSNADVIDVSKLHNADSNISDINFSDRTTLVSKISNLLADNTFVQNYTDSNNSVINITDVNKTLTNQINIYKNIYGKTLTWADVNATFKANYCDTCHGINNGYGDAQKRWKIDDSYATAPSFTLANFNHVTSSAHEGGEKFTDKAEYRKVKKWILDGAK